MVDDGTHLPPGGASSSNEDEAGEAEAGEAEAGGPKPFSMQEKDSAKVLSQMSATDPLHPTMQSVRKYFDTQPSYTSRKSGNN